MVELETVTSSAPIQTYAKTSENEALPANPVPVTLRRGTTRRRGACGMCKLKKVRCDGGMPCMNCLKNNQECEYTLAKKRQTSKKSVVLGPPMNAPASGTEANRMSISITNSAAETLNNEQRSLELTPPSHEGSVNSNNTIQHGSHAQPSISVNHSAQSLMDDYFNDANCSLDLDPEGILLPAGEIKNVLDFSKFSWPVPDANDDCDFDFDIPFAADGLATANDENPDSTIENDYPSYLNQSSQPIDLTEPPRNLVKMLDLNDKITTKSFFDPVPSLNFSLKAIFSWQDLSNQMLSNTEQEDIQRIFSSISPVHNQQTPVNTTEEHQHTYASWYWNDAALMESCRSACFEQPLGVPMFLTRSYFDNYMKEARGRPDGNSVLISLIDSVMAFGFHAFSKSSRRFVSPNEKKEADHRSRIALSSHARVLRSPDTLFKLQTLLAMTIISEQINKAAHSEILAGAINCARALKLENSDMIHSNYRSREERDLAKRALWFLYSIEVPHSLRRGISSSLDRDWIDFAPPQASNETDWFPIQCLYALVISSAASLLYSQRGLRQSAAEREHKLDISFKLLEDWRSHLPPTLKEIHKADIQGIMGDHDYRDMALCMFRQYHEAIFLIYFPWTGTHSKGKISEEARRKGMELCVNSAQVVLTTANQVSSLEIFDSKFLDLISVSICMTFLDVASSSGTQKSIAYLSMGCGIFGRLNLENEVPLSDVLELTRIAQQIKGRWY